MAAMVKVFYNFYWNHGLMRQGKLAAFTRRLGVYKFLPLFFLLGAGIELFMIKVRVGRETFCKYPSRTKTQVVGFLELIDQKIFARVIDQTWTVKKAGYRLRFFITFWGTETKWRSEKLQKERSNIKSSHVNNWTCWWSVSDMGKRLFPAGPKQKIPRQDGFILYMYARDFLVWSCLEVL